MPTPPTPADDHGDTGRDTAADTAGGTAADTAGGLALADPAGRWVLVAAVCASTAVFLDASVVTVALPSIGRDLGASLADLQWTVNAYTLVLASLVLLGGGLGDRFGRRRVLLVGAVWFLAASLLCAVAPTVEVLVAARALQGVGGALLTPLSLALLQSVLREADRARAIGLWSGATTLATLAAPVIGGALSAVSWRWVFWINVPVVGVTIWLALRHVPARQALRDGRLDVAGAALAALALGAGTWALITAGADPAAGASGAGTDAGVSTGSSVVVAAVVAVLAAAGFVLRERTARAPVVPLGLFRDRTFAATNGYTLLVYGALGGLSLLVTLQLQVSLGWTPLQSGAATLPWPLLLGLLSGRAGALAQRTGARPLLVLGAALAAAGFAVLAAVGAGDSYAVHVLPGVLLLGLGFAALVAPLTAAVLAAAPQQLAGTASAVNNAVARTAGLVVVAGLPALVGLGGRAYTDPEALSPAYATGMLVCAGLVAAGAVLAAVGMPRRTAPTPRAA